MTPKRVFVMQESTSLLENGKNVGGTIRSDIVPAELQHLAQSAATFGRTYNGIGKFEECVNLQMAMVGIGD